MSSAKRPVVTNSGAETGGMNGSRANKFRKVIDPADCGPSVRRKFSSGPCWSSWPVAGNPITASDNSVEEKLRQPSRDTEPE
ncbi:hypothetical protein AAHA92_10539 [Salvia divinorum]|uniref:Uncharacterized protein n=1 Tax=Salvia divinorum TaxID=28513 RepID=A0ABD1HYJ0_SALDI